MRPEELGDQVVIVLVQPQYPGNIGACARAMKNMGLHRLVIVDPPAFDAERARWMAPGCADVIAGARLVATLDEALEGVHRVVGSTARHRKQGHPIHEPRALANQILAGDDVTAILFGREDFGLSKAHVQRCESILRIPTPEHASLNLGQAVLLVCHSLFEAARARGGKASGRSLGGSRGKKSTHDVERRGSPRDRRADTQQTEPAVAELVGLLDRVGYTRGAAPEKVALTGRQALQRAGLSIRHVEALRGMVARLEWALDHPGVDWKKTRKS